jgi:putative transposase
VRRLREEFQTSERRVCELMRIPRMSYRYQSRRDDTWLRERLVELAREKPRYGYRRLNALLQRHREQKGGERINHKRVERVYRDLGLSVRRNRRKRLQRMLRPRPILTAPNQEWAIDFASDVAASGHRVRIFSVVDSYTRECLALEVDRSLPSRRVTRVLARIIETRGIPVAIRSDNGPEMSSRHFLAWCIEKRIDAIHIQPGKPTQNAHVESFHGRLRDECLNVSWFWNLWDARRKIAAWRTEYNYERPHSALGYRTPVEFAGKAASLSKVSNITRPDLPQGFPDGSAVAVAPAPALTQIRPREEGLI